MTWWAFDIETSEWDVLVHATALADDGRKLHMATKDEIAGWYLSLPSSDIVWSHNGGGYDFILLISSMPGSRWTARMAGGSIVSCRASKGAECRDSMRLFPGSLAKWTRRKQALDLPCSCGEECGGYCAIRPDMRRAHRRRMIDYCDQDCVALLSTLRADIERLEGEDFDVIGHRDLPRLTFGAVAWHTAARMAGLDPTEQATDWTEYDAGRRAYYGGRCEVGRIHSAIGHRYDVNSMYPWALLSAVPCGRYCHLRMREAGRAYREDTPGVYRAVVDLPTTDIPALPHRYAPRRASGRLTPDRLVWSTGTVAGHWTQLELSAAEHHGAKIRRILGATIWEDFEPLYAPYVGHVWGMRDSARAAGDDRWASILKWYANALSGKLAQHPEACTIRVIGDRDDEPPPNNGWSHVGGRVFSKPSRRLASNCRPVQAAYLTSRARVALLDRLMRHSGQWLYCDTDSSYLVSPDPRDVGPALGQWKDEGPLRDWTALAPKLYRYRDGDGAPVVRARGVPLPKRDAWGVLDLLRDGGTFRATAGVERLKSGGGAFRRRVVTRTHHDAHTDRCGTRYVLPDGTTRPLHRERDGRYV